MANSWLLADGRRSARTVPLAVKAERHLTISVAADSAAGSHSENGYVFQKELVGAYEAGGRFITLRMEASYPLPDGGNDVHRALVVVGTEQQSGAITGRAYTDGGGIRDYAVERREFALQFEDESPDHERRWKRARKILRPTDSGFEERLEVDAGDGYTPYYVVQMRSSER